MKDPDASVDRSQSAPVMTKPQADSSSRRLVSSHLRGKGSLPGAVIGQQAASNACKPPQLLQCLPRLRACMLSPLAICLFALPESSRRY